MHPQTAPRRCHGALAAGADRLTCRCGQPHCPAAATPAPAPVVIHVVADRATLDGTSQTPASTIGSHALVPAELVAELARTATDPSHRCAAEGRVHAVASIS
jgi:hypothetical protein